MKRLFGLIVILLMKMTFPSNAQEQQVVPYTLADRDRAIQTEVKVVSLDQKMEVKLNAMEQKMDAKFKALEQKLDTKIEAVNSRVDYLF